MWGGTHTGSLLYKWIWLVGWSRLIPAKRLRNHIDHITIPWAVGICATPVGALGTLSMAFLALMQYAPPMVLRMPAHGEG